MPETQGNTPLLHRKEWQTMMPALAQTYAGMTVIADDSSEQDLALVMATNTAHYLYSHKEDDYVQIPSGGFPIALAPGTCGSYHPWSKIFTANGGSTNYVSVAAATHNICGFVVDQVIEFLTGTVGNIGNRSLTITRILTDAGTGNITLFFSGVLPALCTVGDTFRIKSGSFFVLNAGTLAATNYFKRFDIATLSWSDLAVTGLPAIWGNDGEIITPYIDGVVYDSGTATSGTLTTLTLSARNWAVNQFANYQVRITAGTGVGQKRTIISNTANTLTFATGALIDSTSQFVIEGDENALYIMGNNAVALYKYSISANTSITLAPTVARAAVPSQGMSANFVAKTDDPAWADVSAIKDGRYIYSLRGGGTTIIDRFDIALVTWLPASGVNYNSISTFLLGTSTFCSGKFIYIAKDGNGSLPQRFYKYDVVGNVLIPVTTDWYFGGPAVVGAKMWIKKLSPQGVVKWIYCLQSSSINLRRIMIY